MIQVITDVLPGMWVCPHCGGVIALDRPINPEKYKSASAIGRLSTGDAELLAAYYFGRIDWSNQDFFFLVREVIHPVNLSIAQICQADGWGNGGLIVSRNLIDMNTLEYLYGPFASG